MVRKELLCVYMSSYVPDMYMEVPDKGGASRITDLVNTMRITFPLVHMES
jgi:hypothetical protein